MLPRWLRYSLLIVAALGLVPFACVARSRAVRSEAPRWHLIQDMDNQGRYDTQQASRIFVDRRAMRVPPLGTIAQGELDLDDHLYRGLDGDGYATGFPVELTAELLERGLERYEIFCAPCHGLAGFGDGMVSGRAEATQQSAWVPPSSFHDELVRSRPAGHLYNTIANGIRNMPAYGDQIPVRDRWAIVAYVRALQRSQQASLDDVPQAARGRLVP